MGEVAEDLPVVVGGRYRVVERIGAGGMGTVWRAVDELLGREVAIKQVRLTGLPAAEAALARERTMREARIAAALHHPHVVSIFDVVVEDGEPRLVLEYLPSRSLGGVLEERGTLPAVEVAAIGADGCWVQVVQREYLGRNGDPRIEALWVTYYAPRPEDELCRTATTLAAAAASRLPPPR